MQGGYNYNVAGQDELVYSDNVNAWTAWCGSRGTWVTHDTQQEVISPTAGWVIAYLRPATGHPYPS